MKLSDQFKSTLPQLFEPNFTGGNLHQLILETKFNYLALHLILSQGFLSSRLLIIINPCHIDISKQIFSLYYQGGREGGKGNRQCLFFSTAYDLQNQYFFSLETCSLVVYESTTTEHHEFTSMNKCSTPSSIYEALRSCTLSTATFHLESPCKQFIAAKLNTSN